MNRWVEGAGWVLSSGTQQEEEPEKPRSVGELRAIGRDAGGRNPHRKWGDSRAEGWRTGPWGQLQCKKSTEDQEPEGTGRQSGKQELSIGATASQKALEATKRREARSVWGAERGGGCVSIRAQISLQGGNWIY